MKKALFTVFLTASVIAQSSTDGTIIFKSIGIENAAFTGVYNVPLYIRDETSGTTFPAGAYPGGITVGLFLSSNVDTPLAIGQLGTATPAQQLYIITPKPSQLVSVPGQPPGSTPSLTIRAWATTAGNFAAAQSASGVPSGEWIFTSKPLGGVPPDGGLPIPPPTLTGWGPENGSGFEMIPEPSIIALSVLGIGALVVGGRRKLARAN
jgi:hypothetical protein